MIMKKTSVKQEIKIGKYYRFNLDLRNCVLTEPETYVAEKHGRKCRVMARGSDDWDWMVTFGKSWGDKLLVNSNELVSL